MNKVFILIIISVFLVQSSFSLSESYFYANEQAILLKDDMGITPLYQDRTETDITVDNLPFGQNTATTNKRFTYTGKEQDTSQLYYYQARYYDTKTGKFTSKDAEKTNHAYNYVENNPQRYKDPDGNEEVPFSAEVQWDGPIGGTTLAADFKLYFKIDREDETSIGAIFIDPSNMGPIEHLNEITQEWEEWPQGQEVPLGTENFRRVINKINIPDPTFVPAPTDSVRARISGVDLQLREGPPSLWTVNALPLLQALIPGQPGQPVPSFTFK